jgi:hypothetical protein
MNDSRAYLAATPLAGDLMAAASQRLGADRLASWLASKLGVDCGCEWRRVKLNEIDAKLRKRLGWAAGGPGSPGRA